MHPSSTRSRNLTLALMAAALAALGPSAAGFAQDEQETAAASTATPADQPRSRRDRRRAEAAAELPLTQVQTVAAPAAAEPAVETVEEKLVCKTIKLTGTKIGQRVCGTPEQWAARTRRTTEEAQDTIQEIRDRSSFPAAPEVPLALP